MWEIDEITEHTNNSHFWAIQKTFHAYSSLVLTSKLKATSIGMCRAAAEPNAAKVDHYKKKGTN